MRRSIQTTGVRMSGLPLTTFFVFAAGVEWEILTREIEDLYHAEEYDRAVIIARKALEIVEKNVGPYHPNVAVNLSSLAGLYHLQEQYALAEPLYKRALAIYGQAFGPGHPELEKAGIEVARTMKNLALFYRSTKRDKKAEELEKASGSQV